VGNIAYKEAGGSSVKGCRPSGREEERRKKGSAGGSGMNKGVQRGQDQSLNWGELRLSATEGESKAHEGRSRTTKKNGDGLSDRE